MGHQEFKPTPLAEILKVPKPRKRVKWRGRPGEVKPLWAILGHEPPADWRPPEPEQAAAPLGESTAPGIHVTARPSLGVGPSHTVIEYVSEEGDPQWLSAGPKQGRLVSGIGMLDEAGEPIGERPGDRPGRTTAVGRVVPREGMTDAEQWEVLKALDAYYRDNVDYDVNPAWQDSYNSNSYTRGLLDAAGATYTAPFDDYVGGRSPLPARHFTPPHLRDTGFEDSLKPNQVPPRFRRLPRQR